MAEIAIIGAGIAGLAAAIRIRAQGFDVQVFEKEGSPGGKVMEWRRNGFRFDLGPSLLTQPDRVEELFHLAGEDPPKHFRYQRLDTVCHYFWPDGSTLEVPDDPALFARRVGQLADGGSAEVERYLEEAALLYETAGPLFLERPFPTREALMSSQGQKIGRNPMLLDPFFSMHGRNRRSFSDPRIVQLFDRYATYNGSNPYKAPATLKMIAHLEHAMGAYFPDQGMYSIARELSALALRMGVIINLNSPVEKILTAEDGKTVRGIRAGGKELKFDGVVSDVDINTLYLNKMLSVRRPLLGRHQKLSSSALIFYWGVKGHYPSLDLHNILFSQDYQREFDYLFRQKTLYSDPTVYLFISSKRISTDAPEGHENWFAMINAPENLGQDWDQLIKQARENILMKIRTIANIDLAGNVVLEHVENPRTIEARTGSWHGSLYGASSNSRMSAFSRHPNHRRGIENLWFTGGSVHPGGGIPLCLAGASIVSEQIAQYRINQRIK